MPADKELSSIRAHQEGGKGKKYVLSWMRVIELAHRLG